MGYFVELSITGLARHPFESACEKLLALATQWSVREIAFFDEAGVVNRAGFSPGAGVQDFLDVATVQFEELASLIVHATTPSGQVCALSVARGGQPTGRSELTGFISFSHVDTDSQIRRCEQELEPLLASASERLDAVITVADDNDTRALVGAGSGVKVPLILAVVPGPVAPEAVAALRGAGCSVLSLGAVTSVRTNASSSEIGEGLSAAKEAVLRAWLTRAIASPDGAS